MWAGAGSRASGAGRGARGASSSRGRHPADVKDMAWLLLVVGVVAAWAMLNVRCAARHRRVRVIDLDAAARRPAAARDADRAAAAKVRKNRPPPAAAA